MPGSAYRSLKKPAVYEALRRKGMSKERAAKVSNGRAARSRKRRKR